MDKGLVVIILCMILLGVAGCAVTDEAATSRARAEAEAANAHRLALEAEAAVVKAEGESEAIVIQARTESDLRRAAQSHQLWAQTLPILLITAGGIAFLLVLVVASLVAVKYTFRERPQQPPQIVFVVPEKLEGVRRVDQFLELEGRVLARRQ